MSSLVRRFSGPRRMPIATVVRLVALQLLGAPLLASLPLVQHGAPSGAPKLASPAPLTSVQDIKEINYYPASGGWTYMWTNFDPGAIDGDFARIRAMGGNTVRIFIQPMVFGYPTVDPVMAGRLSQVVDLAAKHSLRVHLSLFDLWSRFGDVAGSKEWLRSLLSSYRDDPRIAVVELHNEINPQDTAAVDWVRQMLPYLATVLPGTLRTVSTASVPPQLFALFVQELGTSTPDFWDYHYYGSAAGAFTQLAEIEGLSAPRPLFVGEVGYSTAAAAGANQAGPEQAQAQWYRAVFAAAKDLGLPTPAPWTLNDFAPGAIPPSPTADKPSQYDFGLYKLDGTPKPAEAVVSQAFEASG